MPHYDYYEDIRGICKIDVSLVLLFLALTAQKKEGLPPPLINHYLQRFRLFRLLQHEDAQVLPQKVL